MNIKDKSSSEHQEQIEHGHHHSHSHDAHSHDEHHNHQEQHETSNRSCCCASNSPILSEDQIRQESQKIKSAKYRSQFYIQNMDCPTEEALIRKKLSTNQNAEALEFNLIKRILTVYHQHSEVDTIIRDLNAIDMRPELIPQNGQLQLKQGKDYKLLKLGIAGGLALLSEVLEFITPHNMVVLILALLAIVLSGVSTYKKGWIALINRNINMNVLMSIAVTGALIIGQWAEAAMVMALFNLSEWIEAKSLDRARDAIGNLLRLVPETVLVLRNSDEWVETKVDDIQVDEILKVSPGERIPLDGVITKGMTTINQASITGESLPVERGVGDNVFAGTLNEVGQFEYRVTTLATETTLAKIIHAVEEAQSKKAPTQKFVDKFAKVYTPVAFLIALLVAIVPPLLSSATWLSSIYNGLVLLVIACPCALVISTPITIVSGLVAATKRGIIVKGGTYLEQGRKLTMLALDKTGTLTVGRPALTDSYFIETEENHKLGNIAYSLTKQSDHPVSIAIANQLQKEYNEQQLHNFTAILGSGTQAEIDGQTWYLTNIRFARNKLDEIPASVSASVEKFEKEGKSIVLLFNEYEGIQSIFAVADTVKESSQQALIKLRKMGVKSVMLTGDNHFTAEAIGQEVGIDDVKAELLPTDKSTAIIEMKKEGFVGMVGDGINDAPALVNADIGFAMGKIGTDTAIETADVALMEDDLEKIPDFIALSKSTHQILVQNISFAIGVKILFFGLALFGLADMWMAIFADVGTSLLVIANGLRMMRK